MNDNLLKSIKITIQVVLLMLLIAYGITGYGITEYRTVEMLSFGLVTKPLSFEVHNNLLIPFLLFLLLHIFFKPLFRLVFKTKK